MKNPTGYNMNINLLIVILCHVPMCYAIFTTNTTTGRDRSVSYNGYQLWKVTTDTAEKLDLIDKMQSLVEVTSWGKRIKPDLLINRDMLEDVRKRLRKNNIHYKVLIDDVQKAIDRQNPLRIDDLKLTQLNPTFSFEAYHTLPTIYKYLRELDGKYPHMSMESIGFSVEDREIPVAVITNGNSHNRAVFIEGGIHAREWISPASVLYIIDYLVKNISSEAKFIKDFDWYILPIANPDGYYYTHITDRLWRKNRSKQGSCYGTDLNRNFGYEWSTGTGNPCEVTFSGPGPFSEPETIAIRNFIRSFPHSYWKAYISVHSYGQYILFPYGYQKILPDDYRELDTVAMKAAKLMSSDYGEVYDCSPISDIYVAPGVSIDWAKAAVGIKYPYTLELADRGEYAFLLPASQIVSAAEQCWNIVRIIVDAASHI